MKFEKELEVVKKLIKKAGKILLEKRKDLDIKIKEDMSYVTNVDYASSEFLQTNLIQEFPDYGILDEESKNDGRSKKYCWVIDPLDGTFGYVKGGDTFGVLIGLLEDGVPVLGVVYKPLIDELIWGIKGEGAFFENGERLHVNDKISNDILMSAERENPFFDSFEGLGFNPIKMPTSYKINEVARGNYTSFICHPDTIMGLWDLCAHQVILEEAGGVITDVYGDEIDYLGERDNMKGVIATHPKKHEELLKIFK